MLSRSAIVKLKAILVIDLIIMGSAAGAYFYLQGQGIIAVASKPAEFTLTNLTIDPLTVEAFEPVLITFNLTNVGDQQGDYMANLTINNILTQNQTITLQGGESAIIEFTATEENIGNYTVVIGDLTGSFTIKAPTLTSSNIRLSNLKINPFEAWADQPINATFEATNAGTEAESLQLKLMVDDSMVETKTIELAPGATTTLQFTFNVTTEGKHSVKVNTLSGTLKVVPTGYHTLTVGRSGQGSTPVPFTLDGVAHDTFYTELLPVGEHKLVMPDPLVLERGVLAFDHWDDGTKNPSRTIDLESRLVVVVTYRLISGEASCPSLFTWNGTDFVYLADVSNPGWLGYIGYVDSQGQVIFKGGNPWDYVKLDKTQLSPVVTSGGSYYDMTLVQRWDEIFYLDRAYMVVVDHPADLDVFSSGSNYLNPNFAGQIYTVSKNLTTPLSAVNQQGQDVTSNIAKMDGVFTPGVNGNDSPSWDNITMNRLTVDLGDLSNATQIRLLLKGMVDWGPAEVYYNWINSFLAQPVPNGTQITPPSSIEIKSANGSWVPIPQDRQIPLPADYVPKTFIADLTGLFPTDTKNFTVRISSFWNVTFDYIGVDTSQEQNITVQTINASASLYQEFSNTIAQEFNDAVYISSGSFTRYGDITELLQNADNEYAIGRQGDAVSLHFSTDNLTPPESGMVRDYFFFVACWFKDAPEAWGYGFTFTTSPLPFIGMSGFPYPSTESYPYDPEHTAYLNEYNTRIIPPPTY
jgi:hypothetical protein